MSAPKRTRQQSILAALRGHSEIKLQLDRLERAANENFRKEFPWYGELRKRYPAGFPRPMSEIFLECLMEVVSRNDWRSPLEWRRDRLWQLGKILRKAVNLAQKVVEDIPSYSVAPLLVLTRTAEWQAEHERIKALPTDAEKLRAIWYSIIEQPNEPIIQPEKVAPAGLLQAISVYASNCSDEACRLDGILKTRNRHFDRLGPLLLFISCVEAATGKPQDGAVARLLADAYEIAGNKKQFSPDAIRKIRERHLPSSLR